jgi:hypothetical protein
VLESPLASKSNPNPSEQAMIEFVPSGYISIREALSRSIWRMRARPLAGASSVKRIGRLQGTCLGSEQSNATDRSSVPKSWPELRIRKTAAQTRIVSGGGFWPIRRELSRHFKYMARGRIPEFESYHPSHAVVSSAALCPRC